jgi:hypothetical protein
MRLWVQSQAPQIKTRREKYVSRTGNMAQVVEGLPSKPKVLSSKPSSAK